MPLEIIRNDITKMRVDAIVNTGNRYLRDDGGVNGAIHKAAGPLLALACKRLGGLGVAEAKITRGYRLPCKYIIHTVSPVWQGGSNGEGELLAACYRNALEMALRYNCRSVAFPLIASGARGFSKRAALQIATDTISNFLLNNVPDNDLMVYLVMFTRESLQVSQMLFAQVRQFIDDVYVDEHWDYRRESMRAAYQTAREMETAPCEMESAPCAAPAPCEMETAPCASQATGEWNPVTLEEALNMIDESFAEMLLRMIREKGMKNSDCYKKANIDKKLFSKIIHTPGYRPKKTTALALAVALELTLGETREFLMKAGLALSHSDKFDIIVEFFIMKGKYDIFEINEMLYAFDQALLGGAVL